MSEKNKNLKGLFLRFVFILTALIYLVKAESSLYTPTNYCDDPIQTKIELVVSTALEYDLSLYKLDAPPKQTRDFTHTHIDFSSINKFALLHYHNYVLHQLNSFNRTFTLHHQLTSILQKNNIWHQSSDEDPLLFA